MTLLEVLAVIKNIPVKPMTANQRLGYDCDTDMPLIGYADGITVVVDGDRLQLEIVNETGHEDIYSLELTKV